MVELTTALFPSVNGNPVIDMGYMIRCLNRLDVSTQNNINEAKLEEASINLQTGYT